MDFTLYLISQSYLSARKLAELRAALLDATEGPSELIRLEREGDSFWTALDRATEAGAEAITLRPLGLPNAESLLKWLRGAVGEWLWTRGPTAPTIWITEDLSTQADLLKLIGQARPERHQIAPRPRGANGKGWDRPPAHRHHILVCTGPRCHLRDSPDLLGLMKAEIARAGLSQDCLVSSTGCLFPCNAGPVVIHYPNGQWFQLPDATAVTAFVRAVLVAGARLPAYETFQTGEPTHAP